MKYVKYAAIALAVPPVLGFYAQLVNAYITSVSQANTISILRALGAPL